MADDFSVGLQGLGSAVSDLFGSRGASASASSYAEAAMIAQQNAQISAQATKIQEAQEARQIYQTIGTQRSQVAAAGLSESGSAIDLLRSSQSQGALTQALTAEQGAITENSYAEQSGLYAGLASAAQASSTAQKVGSVLQAAGGIVDLYKAYTSLTGGSSTASGTAAGDAAVSAGPTDAGITSVGAGAADTGITDTGSNAVVSDGVTDQGVASVGSGATDAGIADAGGVAAGAAATDAVATVGVEEAGGSVLAEIGSGILDVLAFA
jgi:hypothetical protein